MGDNNSSTVLLLFVDDERNVKFSAVVNDPDTSLPSSLLTTTGYK